VRIVVGEDSVLLREGIVRLLEDAGFEIAGQAGDAEDLVRKVAAHKPDLAVVDIRMPPTNTDDGLRAALEIRRRLPGTGVLVLSQYVEERYAIELVGDRADGCGYLLKDRVADVDGFIDAVRRVGDGGSALDPEVVATMLGRRRDDQAGEGGSRFDRRGALEPGDRRAARRHRARGGEARHQHLRQARPLSRAGGSPARARGTRLPARLTRGASESGRR
jgi:DNA-binding NarL/FixJ family response regulator